MTYRRLVDGIWHTCVSPEEEVALSALLRIGALHDIEVAQRHKPITWWRERFGADGWVEASTKARRDLDEAIREAVALAKKP